MHALVVRVTIHAADSTREVLNNEVVPQASGAPGFQAGYWRSSHRPRRLPTRDTCY